MLTEDLAALDTLTEDIILDELHDRLRRGEYHTFIGDILLILNPNEENDIYDVHVSLMLDFLHLDHFFIKLTKMTLSLFLKTNIKTFIIKNIK